MTNNTSTDVNFKRLMLLLAEHFALSAHSIHGPDHWARVERNGLRMAARNEADETIVRLFAIFHDAERHSDGWDEKHGQRAAELASNWHGDVFEIGQDRLELLYVACELHHEGGVTDDVTIGTCWDADRLDLTRVCATPDPDRMSTKEGKILARSGKFDDEGFE